MRFATEEHYRRLASTYDGNWAHAPDYVEWMNDRIASRLRFQSGSRIADIGGGTGLFLRRLLEHASEETPILCVDPSQEMLDQLPDDPRLVPVCATGEEIVSGEVKLPYDQVDAILIKETVHHFVDIPGTLAGLGRLLAPGGRMLIVTLPPWLEYPLFRAALDRFATRHPDPENLAQNMRDAGLSAELTYDVWPVTVSTDHYADLVRKQWMSVLSTFSADEIEEGVKEIKERHPEPTVSFEDRFAFVLGVRR